MEQRRIDALARIMSHLLDRRETLAATIALVVATVSGAGETAAKKHGGKGGKGGGKGGGHGHGHGGKHKHKHKHKHRGGGGPRNCSDVALEPGADLHNCDLRERTDLAGADLTDADISDALLTGVDATGATFRGAHFWRAKLDGATLKNVDFRASATRKTDLFGVDFTDANLDGADGLFEAYYVEAPHDYVTFCHTTMPNGDTNDDDCPANG
jgi:hypothetical protein